MPIVFDIETELFGPGNMAPKPVALCYQYQKQPVIIIGLTAMEEWFFNYIIPLLQSNDLVIGHHVAYDFACLYKHIPTTRPYIWELYRTNHVVCSEVRERLVTNAQGVFFGAKGYSLKACVKRHFGIEIEKGVNTWRLRYAELADTPLSKWPKEAISYLQDDVHWCSELFKAQNVSKYVIPTQFFDSRASWILHLITCRGIITDHKQTKTMWDQCLDIMLTKIDKLTEYGLIKESKTKSKVVVQQGFRPLPKISINKKIQQSLVKQAFDGNPPLTEKGNIKTDEKTIKKCDTEVLNELKEYQKYQKIASTFISKFQVPIVHGSFNAVVQTNRTSSFNPNLQNQARLKGVRECLVARPGYVFAACDYDSQEVRTLAQTLQDILGRSSLAEKYRINPDYDPHTEFAAKLAGISPQEGLRRKRAKDPNILALRQRSKAANFGYPGGMREQAFMEYAEGYGVKITFEEAKILRDEWLEQIPEMKGYFLYCKQLSANNTGTLVLQRSGFTRGRIGYTNACNTHFQSLAAHASKAALWAVGYECYNVPSSDLYKSWPICFVHDEIIIECKEKKAARAAKRLEQVMMEQMQPWVPNVPVRASAHLMRRWSKKAEPVYKNDILIPWEDR